MKKPKNTNKQQLYEILDIDQETQKCIDKVEIVSLVHGTGQVALITNKGKEIKIKLADLIKELLTDQTQEVIEKDCTIFENVLTIKYPERRSEEFDKIFKNARLICINTKRSKLGCFEVIVQVNHIVKIQEISGIKTNRFLAAEQGFNG